MNKDKIIKFVLKDKGGDFRYESVIFIKEEQSEQYGLIFHFTGELEIFGAQDFWVAENINKYEDKDLGCHMHLETIDGKEYLFCGC